MRTSDISWHVFWPLPRWATILGFKYAFVYPFGGSSDLCLYPVPLCDLSLFFVPRSECLLKLQGDALRSGPANLCGVSTSPSESPIPFLCSFWCLRSQELPFFLQSHQS